MDELKGHGINRFNLIEDIINFKNNHKKEVEDHIESERHHVINDFKMFFNPPVYHKQENDRISSVQAGHIVAGPTGFYLVETKNWSRESVKNMDLFSPVKQLKRTGFALFVYLNNLISNGTLYEFESGWGVQKLSIKNVLLMINFSTNEQFQFVKIVTISEINRYH